MVTAMRLLVTNGVSWLLKWSKGLQRDTSLSPTQAWATKGPWWENYWRILNNHIFLPSGGVGRYQAVYLGRDELTRSFCQHLVPYLNPTFFRYVYLNYFVWKVHFGLWRPQVAQCSYNHYSCTTLFSRLAPALHFSSRNFSNSQGSLEKIGESTLNQEEVDKFRAMSRSTFFIHSHQYFAMHATLCN